METLIIRDGVGNTVMRENGTLNTCEFCNKPLHVVDGSEPDDSSEFWERYECENGHTGRYVFDHGKERFSGACRA